MNKTEPGHYEGWLYKKGKLRKNWKKRWFVLNNGEIRYYTNQVSKQEAKTKLLGFFSVKDNLCGPASSGELRYKHSFQVRTKERVWWLIAENAKSYHTWKSKIIQSGGQWDESLKRNSYIDEDGNVVVYRQSVHKNPLHAAQEAKQVYTQLKILYENTLDKRIFWENMHQFILEFEEIENASQSSSSSNSIFNSNSNSNSKVDNKPLNRSNTLVSPSSIIITGVPPSIPMSTSPKSPLSTSPNEKKSPLSTSPNEKSTNSNGLSSSPNSSSPPSSVQVNIKEKGMNSSESVSSELLISNKRDLSSVIVNFISSNDGSLKDLILDATQLEDDGIINIINAIKSTASRSTTSKISPIYLERIVLSENIMTGFGVQAVMEFINTPLGRELNTLFLDNNPVVGNETILQSLCKAMSINASITVLSIAGCHITDTGAEMLGKMITLNGNLSSLCIDNNKIGNRGVQAIANALLINISLQELHLEGNEIGEPALAALSHALVNNHSLIQLSFSTTESFINSNSSNSSSLLDSINNLLERNRNPKLKLFSSRSELSPNQVTEQSNHQQSHQDLHESTDQAVLSIEESRNKYSSIGVVPKQNEALVVQELKPEEDSSEALSTPSDSDKAQGSSFSNDLVSKTKRYQMTSSGTLPEGVKSFSDMKKEIVGLKNSQQKQPVGLKQSYNTK